MRHTPRQVPGHPRLSYLICTTPRSGSTLLCELLEGTGIAGRPDEYFQQLRSTGLPMSPRDYLGGGADLLPGVPVAGGQLVEHSLYDPRRFASFGDYVAWVKERATTDNGVLGFKIMWPYLPGLVEGLSGDARAEPHAVLSASFPRLGYVWLRRSDKVRQAVSLWRAVQTWHWRQDAAGGGKPQAGSSATLRYSYEAIDHLRRLLVSSDRAWETYFEATGTTPLTLTYENFVHEMDETVTALLHHIGVKLPPHARRGIPRTARQADATSEEWITRFRSEFAAGVPALR